MDYLFFQMTAVNGYDSLGHYLRAALIANSCSIYSSRPLTGCTANFQSASGSAAPALASTARRSKTSGGSIPANGSVLDGLLGQGEDPGVAKERKRNIRRIRRQASHPSPGLGRGEPMLDYLLGGDQ
jgi:hypothetical protein